MAGEEGSEIAQGNVSGKGQGEAELTSSGSKPSVSLRQNSVAVGSSRSEIKIHRGVHASSFHLCMGRGWLSERR